MTKKRTLQILRGTTLQNNAYTGSAGELTMDTTKNELRLHDGSTAGGHKVGINTTNASDGYFLSYNTITHDVVWKPLQELIPQLSNVQGMQRNHAQQYVDNAFKAGNTEIEFHTNMTVEQIRNKSRDLYVTVSRWKRSKRHTEDIDGNDIEIRNRGKYSVMNDQRVKLNEKMYCWRVLADSTLDENNPLRYKFFYTEDNYSDVVADLYSDDPIVWVSCDQITPSNYATCLNALTSNAGYSPSDIGSTSNTIRYEAGDIDTFVHNGDPDLSDWFDGVYECIEYYNELNSSVRIFAWCLDWDISNNPVYTKPTGVGTNTLIPDHFDEMSIAGTVIDYDDAYEFSADRKELKFIKLNTTTGSVGDFCNYLYDSTVMGYVADTGINWISYWFDYPVMPVLLEDCYVIIPKNISGTVYRAGDRVKLKTLINNDMFERGYFEGAEDVTFVLPWDTYYLWMRFLSWQKQCFYDETDPGVSWTVKNDLTTALGWDNGKVFETRAFGRSRKKYRHANEYAQVSEYLEFSLATVENIVRGTTSKSQPIQKRLVIAGTYHGIKD